MFSCSILFLMMCHIVFEAVSVRFVHDERIEGGCYFKIDSELPNDPEQPLYLEITNGMKMKFVEPVILRENYKEQRYLYIPKDGNIFMGCTAGPKKLSLSKITCKSKFVLIDGMKTQLATNKCNARALLLFDDDESCSSQGPYGKLLKMGYKINEDEFLSIYEICHKDVPFWADTYEDLYISHVVGRSQLSEFNRPLSKKNVENEKAIVTINGSKLLPLPFVWIYDFYYPTQQSENVSTFSDNIVLQWSSIYNGNLYLLKNRIQTLARRLERDLRVYTGKEQLYGVGNMFDVDSAIIVKYIWILVHDVETEQCMAFAFINSPIENEDTPDPFEEDICTPTGWEFGNRTDYAQGYFKCVTYDDLYQYMDLVPDLICTYLLYY